MKSSKPSRRVVFAALGGASVASLAGGVLWRQRDSALQAITLKQPEPILATLAASPWIGPMRGNPILWVIGFRNCPWCTAFERVEVPVFLENGVDVRSFVFPPTDPSTRQVRVSEGEAAVLASLYKSRDASMLKQWFASNTPDTFGQASGIAKPADRTEAAVLLDNAAKLSARLETLFVQETKKWGYPALIWRRDAVWRAAFGYRRFTGSGIFKEIQSALPQKH